MRRRLVALLVAAATASAAAAQEPSAARPGERQVEAFLGRLQQAVDRRDRAAVAGMIRYPITVLISGWQVPIRDRSRLVMYYDSIFTRELRCLITGSGVAREGQPPPANPVTVAGGGFSIGEGRVWAQQDGASFQLTRLIIPPGPPTQYSPQKPRRVTFTGSGSSRPPAQFRGILEGDAVESFIVFARKNQLLQASATGFLGNGATVRVFDLKTGARVQAGTPDGARTWRGVIPEPAEYRIDVVRNVPFCDPPLPYLLTVTLR